MNPNDPPSDQPPDETNEVETAGAKRAENPSEPQMVKLSSAEEMLRRADGSVTSATYSLTVKAQAVDQLEVIKSRHSSLTYLTLHMALPSDMADYASTAELFDEMRQKVAEQTNCSARVSLLLTFWILTSWLQDALPIAPLLVLTGPSHEAGRVLSTLKDLCYHSVITTALNRSFLRAVYRMIPHPTLLFSAPSISKEMAALLSDSTNRGYTVLYGEQYQDHYGSKAVYLGEDLRLQSIPQHCLHISLAVTTKTPGPYHLEPLAQDVIRGFQNQLLMYRLKNLLTVNQQGFQTIALSFEAAAMADALGRCLVRAPELQQELLRALTQRAQHQLTDKAESAEGLVIHAALRLCHKDLPQIFVKEIAAEVSRLQLARGERLTLSAERVGHRLKSLGLYTRRLSQDGNGLALDNLTRTAIHNLAAAYLEMDFSPVDENKDCLQCQQQHQLV